MLGELLGPEEAEGAASWIESGALGSASTGIAVDFVFAAVWDRPGLDLRSRSLVTIGALIALRAQDELTKHLQIGLNNGLTTIELEEAVLQTMPYVGIPSTSPAMSRLTAIVNNIAASKASAVKEGDKV
jgi:4-carboxymuconolactone decarboxylase